MKIFYNNTKVSSRTYVVFTLFMSKPFQMKISLTFIFRLSHSLNLSYLLFVVIKLRWSNIFPLLPFLFMLFFLIPLALIYFGFVCVLCLPLISVFAHVQCSDIKGSYGPLFHGRYECKMNKNVQLCYLFKFHRNLDQHKHPATSITFSLWHLNRTMVSWIVGQLKIEDASVLSKLFHIYNFLRFIW